MRRKVELGSGALTALVGVSIALISIRFDYQVSITLEQDFRASQEILLFGSLYVVPGVLVALGAYVDTVKNSKWIGGVIIILGSLFITAFFLLMLFRVPVLFFGSHLWSVLNLLWPTLAIVTSVLSFIRDVKVTYPAPLPRMLEIVAGVATALSGLSVATLHLNRQFTMFEGSKITLILFGLPGLLVAIGSYAHAMRRHEWGRRLLTMGSLLVIASFLFQLIVMAFMRIDRLFVMNLVHLALAIGTLSLSMGNRQFESTRVKLRG